MPKMTPIIVACITALALAAVTSPNASALWDVNNLSLPTGSKVALANQGLVLEHGFLEAAGVRVECTAETILIEGGEIVGPSELRIKGLTFNKCKAAAPCSLASESISTLPLHGLAELDGVLGTNIPVLPLPSKTFAAIHYEGSTCALLGVQPVTTTSSSAVDLVLPDGRDASATHDVRVFSLNGRLKVGSSEALLSGLEVDVEIASGQNWAYL